MELEPLVGVYWSTRITRWEIKVKCGCSSKDDGRMMASFQSFNYLAYTNTKYQWSEAKGVLAPPPSSSLWWDPRIYRYHDPSSFLHLDKVKVVELVSSVLCTDLDLPPLCYLVSTGTTRIPILWIRAIIWSSDSVALLLSPYLVDGSPFCILGLYSGARSHFIGNRVPFLGTRRRYTIGVPVPCLRIGPFEGDSRLPILRIRSFF